MKIVLAIDSFKGSISSSEAEDVAREAICSTCSEIDVQSYAISDGGEGLLEAMMQSDRSITKRTICVHDPLMHLVDAPYGISYQKQTAVIEMALVCGLTMLKPSERNPLRTTSYGLGEVILDSIKCGCRHLIIGIGGSATNDAGIGMLRALGYRYFDEENKETNFVGEDLSRISYIDSSDAINLPEDIDITIAADVEKPLYGMNGAAYVFAAQKGASLLDIEELDKGLRYFSKVVFQQMGIDYSNEKGAGAAGGIGFAFKSFLAAKFKSGIDLLLDYISFNEAIRSASLIITGEGSIDRQTLMGKVPFGVLKRAEIYGVPVVAIAGKVKDKELLIKSGFQDIICINPEHIDLSEAVQISYARQRIRLTVEKLIRPFFD